MLAPQFKVQVFRADDGLSNGTCVSKIILVVTELDSSEVDWISEKYSHVKVQNTNNLQITDLT